MLAYTTTQPTMKSTGAGHFGARLSQNVAACTTAIFRKNANYL